MKHFTEDFVHGMSNTRHLNAVSQQVDSAPSSSTNKSRKRKGKDKTFDQMYSNTRAMAESVATIVPNLMG